MSKAKRKPAAVLPASAVEIDAKTATSFIVNDGPDAFRVRMTPWRMLICDPDVPLEHGCMVVVENEGRTETTYAPGTLTTKHPERAKTLTVATETGLSWQGPREDVFRVTWEHTRARCCPFPE
jgi:hypothetical protein